MTTFANTSNHRGDSALGMAVGGVFALLFVFIALFFVLVFGAPVTRSDTATVPLRVVPTTASLGLSSPEAVLSANTE